MAPKMESSSLELNFASERAESVAAAAPGSSLGMQTGRPRPPPGGPGSPVVSSCAQRSLRSLAHGATEPPLSPGRDTGD